MAFALFSDFGYTLAMMGKLGQNPPFRLGFLKHRRAFFLVLVWGVVWAFPAPIRAAEEARLLERWLVNDALSARTVDHSPWQAFLDRYRVETPDGVLVDYGAVTPKDKAALEAYLLTLRRTDVDRLNQSEQMAFWINAFNALVVSAVLSEYPVASINDVGGGFFSSGPWGEKRFRVYLIDLSLNDIYHRILRPIWADPRVHYALACGARGCPDLLARAFTGKALQGDLDAAAARFINGPKAILQINGSGVRLSRIYDWYRDDFGGTQAGVIDHLILFAGPKLQTSLAGVDTITGHAFDWSLNDSGESR